MQDQYPESAPSFSRLQKWNIGVHVLLSVAAALAIVAMVNYLGHRHNFRFYLSNSAALKLSPLTLQVLASLTNEVNVIVFYDRTQPLFATVSSLIKEYEARSPQVELEFVDYRMPGRAEAVRAQYKLAPGADSSRIIFDSGGQVRTVLSSELSDYAMGQNNEVRRTGFRGEQLFTSALINVTQTKPVVAYFLQGHGEHDPANEDDQRGYSRFARLLENNNVKVKTITGLVGSEVPSDCGVLIIASPTTPLDEIELNKIEKYLNGGGRLFALFGYSSLGVKTGLEQLLWRWNVDVDLNNFVQDPASAQSGESAVLLADNYGTHPIVRPLLNTSLKLVFPRAIAQRQGVAQSADAPKVVEILFTSSEGQLCVPTGNNRAEVKATGRIPLIVALEKGVIQGVTTEKGASRVVVTGDSIFLSNLAIAQAANSDFAALAVNWLVNRDNLLTEIGPSPMGEYQVLLTEDEMKRLRWLFLGVIPGGVLIFGGFVWLRRRA